MKLELKEILDEDIRSALLAATVDDDLERVRQITTASYHTEEHLKDAMFQAGYYDSEQIGTHLQSLGADHSEYLNGYFMSGVDLCDQVRIVDAVELGADIFQDNHNALWTPVLNGNREFAGFLMELGLNPKVAFSDEDMKAFDRGLNIADKDLVWLKQVRENFVDQVEATFDVVDGSGHVQPKVQPFVYVPPKGP